MSTVQTPPPSDTMPDEPQQTPSPERNWRRIGLWAVAAIVVVAGGVALFLLLTGDRTAAAVEDTVTRSIEAENAGDAETFLSLWTDEGLESYDVGTREEIEANPEMLGQDQVTDVEVVEITVDGDTARAIMDGTVAPVRHRVAFDLTQVDDKWMLSGFEFEGVGSPEIPAGATTIDLSLVDYGYEADGAGLEGGFDAINYTNTGTEPHELALVRVNDDGLTGEALVDTVAEMAQSEDRPQEGGPVEFAGFLGFAEPGGEGTAVLAEELEAGRYAMLCLIPSESDGVPHAVKGMITEFEVQ